MPKKPNKRRSPFLESYPDAVCIINNDGMFTDANQAFCEKLGLTKKEIIGTPIGDIDRLLPNLPWLDIKKEKAKGKNPVIKIKNKKGDTYHLEIHTTPTTEDSKVVGNMITAKDVTELKQTEEKLKTMEKKYRTLFEQTDDAVILETLEGKILETNQKASELFGYNWDELQQLYVRDIMTPDIKWHALVEEICARGGARLEIKHKRKDGTVIPVQLSVSLFKMGKIPVMVTLVHDVSKLKKMESELKELKDPLGFIGSGTHSFMNSVL